MEHFSSAPQHGLFGHTPPTELDEPNDKPMSGGITLQMVRDAGLEGAVQFATFCRERRKQGAVALTELIRRQATRL